jgi:integrase
MRASYLRVSLFSGHEQCGNTPCGTIPKLGGHPVPCLSPGFSAHANEADRRAGPPPYRRRAADAGQAEDSATARLHVLPQVGSIKLAGIDVPAVRRLHRAVEGDNRTNARQRRLGGPGAALRAVRVLSAMLTWAVGEGQLSRNPIIGALRLDGGGERTTILDRPEQYAALFSTMDRMVAEGRLRADVRAFVTLIAATGMRRNEARTLHWGDIDLGQRRITLRNPKGAKLGRRGAATETVSLPPIAAAALAAVRPNDARPDDAVFIPARGRLIAVNHDWSRIRAEAELPQGLVLHSLRHSIGTAGIVAGMSTAEVGKMLRHRNIAVTQRYVHLAEASQTRLPDRATEHLLPPVPRLEGTRRLRPTSTLGCRWTGSLQRSGI